MIHGVPFKLTRIEIQALHPQGEMRKLTFTSEIVRHAGGPYFNTYEVTLCLTEAKDWNKYELNKTYTLGLAHA